MAKPTGLDSERHYPAPAILAVWMDIVPEQRDAFNAWYYREHIPERLAVPGFWRGRRFEAVDGGPQYFACYDVADIGVPVSETYLKRLNNPTDSTCRIMPGFRNMTRAICNVTAHQGRGTGSAMLTLQIEPKTELRPDLRRHIVEGLLPSQSVQSGIVSVQFWQADNTPTPATRERELRGRDDRSIDWAVVIEGVDSRSLERAAEQLLAPDSLLNRMSAKPPQHAVYHLLYSLDSRE